MHGLNWTVSCVVLSLVSFYKHNSFTNFNVYKTISITRSHHEEVTTHETRPGPNPIHPPLHTSNLAFNLMNAEFLFYLIRGYVKRRQTFHSSISNLSLNLNSKAHVWNWTVKLCLPITIALTIIQYIQSYNHTIIQSYNT